MERSALVEATEQFTRALDLIAAVPASPALRRDKIKFQIALITPLVHVKGYAAPETKAAVEQAHLLIKQAEALGEHPDDPLLLFTVLYAFWAVNLVAFNGDVMRQLATQFISLAEKRSANALCSTGHRLMGTFLLYAGNIVEGRNHLDRAIELYDAREHRPLATRFGHDIGAAILSFRPFALWMLGFPGTALVEAARPLKAARETDHAPTLIFALTCTTFTHIFCREYTAANAQIDECVALAEEKGAVLFKAMATAERGCVLALPAKPATRSKQSALR